jgi:hypothetical protein
MTITRVPNGNTYLSIRIIGGGGSVHIQAAPSGPTGMSLVCPVDRQFVAASAVSMGRTARDLVSGSCCRMDRRGLLVCFAIYATHRWHPGMPNKSSKDLLHRRHFSAASKPGQVPGQPAPKERCCYLRSGSRGRPSGRHPERRVGSAGRGSLQALSDPAGSSCPRVCRSRVAGPSRNIVARRTTSE